MSHTPGPTCTQANCTLCGEQSRDFAYYFASERATVLVCNDCNDKAVRLFSAAPELLEALEETYSLYGMTDDELRTNWGRVFDCVRTVIAKAKEEK